MDQIASELSAAAQADSERSAPAELEWPTADLGTPLVDLEDSEEVRAALDRRA